MHRGNISHIPGRGGPAGLSEGRLSSALDLDNTATPKIYDRNVISRLIIYISKARVKLLITAGAMGMIIGAIAQLAIPYLIATGTDRFIEQHDLKGLNNLVFIYFGVLAISWLGKFIETR
ncbi:MAG: hypothetical protein NTV30_07790, partial [Chloroflexi bacterium]|nr:hypothetical protein [Chloroflexota bacterium]